MDVYPAVSDGGKIIMDVLLLSPCCKTEDYYSTSDKENVCEHCGRVFTDDKIIKKFVEYTENDERG